jgi:class 3 adenylate cyclase
MNTDLDKLKYDIDQLNIANDEKEAMVESLGKIEKELKTLNFKLERALKEKNTLSTLLSRTSEDLEKSSELIKKMFGRYLSTEVMNSLLEDPSALELGGERRKVTIMMTDLRGFTALSERLKPEQVVQMLNSYFEVMVDVVLQYHGTINEIIGDALLVIFGAPQEMGDRTQRAIALASMKPK